jgi:hypothetical protein
MWSGNGMARPCSAVYPLEAARTIYATDLAGAVIGRSFDHLVGERKQRWRYTQSERLGGLEVDDKLEFIRSLNR